ncbi:MAG TPA: (Fe-S)-binding protein [Acidimicrobiales bacterium]|nr:(Fe-S)-binding protein [Acidimicrobiales bacterium]
MKLAVSDEDLAACVSCGLCLPHCPTYRVTGEESASPRGRIAAMRATHAIDAPPGPEFIEFMDLCVQCRGCEVACPSSVPFGRLMEGARTTLAEETPYQPRRRRMAYAVLGHHRLLLVASSAGAVLQRLHLLPSRLGLPQLPLHRRRLRPRNGAGSRVGSRAIDAWLFTGCVMDAWMRPTHAAALRVMETTGAAVGLPRQGADCCGALHLHGGLRRQARALAHRVMGSMPGDAPVVVDSAGCGAVLKDYGELLGTEEARRFSRRVLDIHEWLAGRADRLPAARRRLTGPVAVQDPCHLRHVQRAHHHVRTVLAPYAELVELDDDGLCCGAGGAYAGLHRDMANEIRDRKVAAIAATGASIVASANPGCIVHLAGAGLDVRHPLDLIAWSLDGR